jgi:hypothetical protein
MDQLVIRRFVEEPQTDEGVDEEHGDDVPDVPEPVEHHFGGTLLPITARYRSA